MSSDANQGWLSLCICSSHTGPQHAMVALHVSTLGQAEPGASWHVDKWTQPCASTSCHSGLTSVFPGERLRRAPRPHGWATWNSTHRVPRVTDITPSPHLFLALAHGKELEAVSAEAASLGQFHEVTGRLGAWAQDEHNGRTGVALLKDGIKADHGGLHISVGRCAGDLEGARLVWTKWGLARSTKLISPRWRLPTELRNQMPIASGELPRCCPLRGARKDPPLNSSLAQSPLCNQAWVCPLVWMCPWPVLAPNHIPKQLQGGRHESKTERL